MKKNISYSEAVIQLESLVKKMENGDFDVDEMATNLKTAQELIKFCKDKLTKTDEEIKKILIDNK